MHDRIQVANARFASEAQSKEQITQPRPKMAPDPVKEHLQFIRANSCYSTLRSVITVGAAISAICAVLWGVGAGIELAGMVPEYKWLAAIGGFIAGGLGIVLVVALYQSAFLFIDIADTLLRHHAPKRD